MKKKFLFSLFLLSFTIINFGAHGGGFYSFYRNDDSCMVRNKPLAQEPPAQKPPKDKFINAGQSRLRRAIERQDIVGVRVCVLRGVSVPRDLKNHMKLINDVYQAAPEQVMEFVSRTPLKGTDGQLRLIEAVKQLNVERVEQLLRGGVDPAFTYWQKYLHHKLYVAELNKLNQHQIKQLGANPNVMSFACFNSIVEHKNKNRLMSNDEEERDKIKCLLGKNGCPSELFLDYFGGHCPSFKQALQEFAEEEIREKRSS